MTPSECLIYGSITGLVLVALAYKFYVRPCSHPFKSCSFPSGGYGMDKMTGKQICFDCSSFRYYRFGEPGEWMRYEHKRMEVGQ